MIGTSAKAIAAALVVLLVSAGAFAAESEYDVKAAFIYNFAKFTRWPAKKLDDPKTPFLICIAGATPIHDSLRGLEGRETHGKPIAIRTIERTSDARQCHILIIGSVGVEKSAQLRKATEGAGVLSIGDDPSNGPDAYGIMLFVKDRRVRFHVYPEAVKSSTVEVNSHLMELSVEYGGGGN